MKRDVECVSQTDSIQDAARKMRDNNIGFLPICDNNKKVLGTLTDRDLAVRVIADGKPLNTRVLDVMTREVVACRPSDDLRRALDLLSQKRKSRILCTDDAGRLVGVISLSDIAQRGEDAQIAKTMREVTGREATTH
jgi:CBS domain-containing protein